MKDKIKECIMELSRIGAVKFGNYTLKSGVHSPIYIDLRLIISYPALLKSVAQLMWDKVAHRSFDLICGVPYTALPIATAISLNHNVPMVMRRKEVKEYGTKKIIEGAFEQGNHCLLIEDLITSGASLFETIEPLEKEGIVVTDIVALIDRQQGGKERLEERGFHFHSVFTLSELLMTLEKEGQLC